MFNIHHDTFKDIEFYTIIIIPVTDIFERALKIVTSCRQRNEVKYLYVISKQEIWTNRIANVFMKNWE